MTVVTTTLKGYGDFPYGEEAYGAGQNAGNSGVQFEAVVSDTSDPEGVQFENQIADTPDPEGVQFFATNLGFFCPGYGEAPYGELPYGATACFASAAVQFQALIVDFNDPQGVQFFGGVVDQPDPEGVQFSGLIVDFADPEGVQFSGLIVDFLDPQGVQINQQIADVADPEGVQFEGISADTADPEGAQFNAAVAHNEGLEFTVAIYNTTQLRILCDFPSRGATSGAGTNAWGNTIATGQNWQTNSQDPAADFTVQNLNTDIVEQVYRSVSGTVTGVNIDCDVEATPGVFLDTLGILNHNLTTGATVTLIGSVNSTFTPIGKTINLTPRLDNIYHIEPDLPLTAFRYWRFQIDDVNNTDGYIEIGTIVFGNAVIFTVEECMTDRILKKPQHFVDSVRTEGFTAVKNNRSLKNRINMRFESLRFDQGNFQNLDEIFKTVRTSQKCLWIPTPSTTDASITERFAVFGKIPELPQQEHNVKGTVGEDLDFITVQFDVDEAE